MSRIIPSKKIQNKMSKLIPSKIFQYNEGDISTEKEDDNFSISEDNLPIGKSIWTKIVKIKFLI